MSRKPTHALLERDLFGNIVNCHLLFTRRPLADLEIVEVESLLTKDERNGVRRCEPTGLVWRIVERAQKIEREKRNARPSSEG